MSRRGPTCGLLREHDLGLGREVLAREDHLLAPVHQAAVDVLSLHHGQLVGGSLGCGQKTRSRREDTPARLSDFTVTSWGMLCPPFHLLSRLNVEPPSPL